MKFEGEHRPWGSFKTLNKNEKCTVKIITVTPNERLSIQYHKHRREYWRVISGSGSVLCVPQGIDLDRNHLHYWKLASVNDEFLIEKGFVHSMKAGEMGMKILEISFGNFDENDIVRLDDVYGRK